MINKKWSINRVKRADYKNTNLALLIFMLSKLMWRKYVIDLDEDEATHV